jgi:hypothetical protein
MFHDTKSLVDLNIIILGDRRLPVSHNSRQDHALPPRYVSPSPRCAYVDVIQHLARYVMPHTYFERALKVVNVSCRTRHAPLRGSVSAQMVNALDQIHFFQPQAIFRTNLILFMIRMELGLQHTISIPTSPCPLRNPLLLRHSRLHTLYL